MSDPVFIVSTGRCGSTALSSILREHPGVLSVSEFFSVLFPDPFPEGLLDADEIVKVLTKPRPHVTALLRLRSEPPEVLYPVDGNHRFTRKSGVPPVALTTLPHLTDDPDPLLDEVTEFLRGQPTQTAGAHYQDLFDWLCARFDRRVPVERSGASIILVRHLQAHFPNARFIHLYRDGRRVAASMSRHISYRLLTAYLPKFLESQASGEPASADMPIWRYGEVWASMVEDGLDALAALDPQRVLSLEFDEVCAAPSPGVAESPRVRRRRAQAHRHEHVDLTWHRLPRARWRRRLAAHDPRRRMVPARRRVRPGDGEARPCVTRRRRRPHDRCRDRTRVADTDAQRKFRPKAIAHALVGEPSPPSPTPRTERIAARELANVRPLVPPKPHDARLFAHERIEVLLDPGSFTEIGGQVRHQSHEFDMADKRPDGDGVVTGWGTIDGRMVFVHAQDRTVYGGALGEAHAQKIQRVLDLAVSTGVPVIALNDGGGARVQEGVAALDGYGKIFLRNSQASGVVPQVSVIMGACAGGAVYSPAITDFTVMVRNTSHMFLTGPKVVKEVTGETVTLDELGGSDVHANHSGAASFVCDTDEEALELVRYILSYFPANNLELAPIYEPEDDPARRCDRLEDIVPADGRQAFDMRAVLSELVDDGEVLEVSATWARNIVCALARLDGHTVGFVANQPSVLAGALDATASEKAARFVRTCDAFNIPLITLVDVPGFQPGRHQEHEGIIRKGAALLFAFCEATVPRIQVILRKAFGGAYIVMNSRAIGADLAFAWPSAEIAVMGASAAVGIVAHRQINGSDPNGVRDQLIADYADRFLSPRVAAERGFIDDVIAPADTRRYLVNTLAMLRTKREVAPARKHGNNPI